ncbi:ubiquitin domain-containing protein 7sl RNA1-related [Anaeramoeba flamelloides]|uniref:Ubiquitin domain-containing protein 7sl RNA1-related n=1 Tax=Anaeramoeba flamelloides TaxID=1746091 RepID=A0AAV7YTG2_9EUKA|nr:ubiquitin domain-containing protein 7sl RNA1-related [Anaeramoeba flamelloides]
MTIRQLKIRLEEKTKIPINSQKLIFGGRALQDASTILGCSIKDGNAIHLVEKTTFPINRTLPQTRRPSSRNINDLLGNLDRGTNSLQDRLNSADSGESHGFIMGVLTPQMGIGQLLQSISRIIQENPSSSSSGNDNGSDNSNNNSNNNSDNNSDNNINNNDDYDDDDDDDDDRDLENENLDRFFEIRRRRREISEQINSGSSILNRNINPRISIINQRHNHLNNHLNSNTNINSTNNKKKYTNEDLNQKLDRVDQLLNTIEEQLNKKKSGNEIKVKKRKKKRRVNKGDMSQEKEIKKWGEIKNKRKDMEQKKEKGKNIKLVGEKKIRRGGGDCKIEREREIIGGEEEEEEEENDDKEEKKKKRPLIKLKKTITKKGKKENENEKEKEIDIENEGEREKGGERKRKKRKKEIKRKRKEKKEISTELQIMKLVDSFKRMKNSIYGLDLILKSFPKILNGKINSQKKQSELKRISDFLKAFGYVLLHLSITTNTLKIVDNQIMIEPSRLGDKLNEKQPSNNQNNTPDPNRRNNQNDLNNGDNRNNTNIESNENDRNQNNEGNQNQPPTQIIRQELTFPHGITIGQTQLRYSGGESNGNRNVNRNESNTSPGILNFISSLSRVINNSIQERTQDTNEESEEERKDEQTKNENRNEKEDKD